MKAEIICTGTELLLGQIINSNAQLFSKALAESGIDLYKITTVGDNKKRIEEAIAAAGETVDLIILNGGLGPTEDDQTREALVSVLGLGEEIHPPTLEKIREYGKSRGLPYLKNNDKVAEVPKGCVVFANQVGSAPGSAVEVDGRIYILTPGPPHELEPLLTQEIMPWLRQRFQLKDRIMSRVMKVAGIGESTAEERVRDLIASSNPTLAPTVKRGEIHFRITAKSAEEKEAIRLLDEMEMVFRERLGTHVFGKDHDTLEMVVGQMLLERKLSISCAESCTGGLLASSLTDVPGSSNYLQFSAITYSDEWKETFLGVPWDILTKRGAVSAETVQAMASGIRAKTGSDIGVAISGIAGPGGGSLEKPVGLVYIGIDYKGEFHVKKLLLSDDRLRNKSMSVKRALSFIYEVLVNAEA